MNKTILFVDDDEDDRELLLDVVTHSHPEVNVAFAENGLRALQYLSEGQQNLQLPCLIVLDLNMPVLDGKETYKKIREELKINSVPVMIFTSSQNPNDKMLFNKLGVEFITKPDEYIHLNEVVNRMVSVCR
jgi:CheY-like chemotaxis protein